MGTTTIEQQQPLHQLGTAIRNKAFDPKDLTFRYATMGGKCYNFELYRMKCVVEDLAGFDPLDMIEEGAEVTPEGLVDVAVVFIEMTCDKAKKALVSYVDPKEFKNFMNLSITVPMGALKIPVGVEVTALPEYSPGDQPGTTAADLFLARTGRVPEMNTVISTTHVNPNFAVSGVLES